MRIRKSWVTVCLLCVATAASAADLIVTTTLTPDNTANGTQVQLREVGPSGCYYVGAFREAGHEHPIVWGTIDLARKRCGDLVSPTTGMVGLSRTHTYMDANGQIRPGYSAGDVVASGR